MSDFASIQVLKSKQPKNVFLALLISAASPADGHCATEDPEYRSAFSSDVLATFKNAIREAASFRHLSKRTLVLCLALALRSARFLQIFCNGEVSPACWTECLFPSHVHNERCSRSHLPILFLRKFTLPCFFFFILLHCFNDS